METAFVQAWLQADDEEGQDLVFKALKEIALDIGLSTANVCDPELMAMSLLHPFVIRGCNPWGFRDEGASQDFDCHGWVLSREFDPCFDASVG